ncbi:BQ2448_332 [Microbotryum intermedium]|uniref:BQ2448_332 protein n=1 Tax=Microbotryum intermedium TaxID=269621 RepID=A0A238F800_9BASI|nr:BQ2448_332 [Microbotryum intermedium]
MSALHRRNVSSASSSRSNAAIPRLLDDFSPLRITIDRSKPRRLLRRVASIVRSPIKRLTPFPLVCLIILLLLPWFILRTAHSIRTAHYPPLVAPLSSASRPIWERHHKRRVVPAYEALSWRQRQRLEESSMKRVRNVRERLMPLVAKKAPVREETEREQVKKEREVTQAQPEPAPAEAIVIKEEVPKPAHTAKPAEPQHLRFAKEEAKGLDEMVEIRSKLRPKPKVKPNSKPKGGKSKNGKRLGTSSGKKGKGKKTNKKPK